MVTDTGFVSVLWVHAGAHDDTLAEPDFFGDLELDQIVASATAGRAEYDLQPLFRMPVDDVATVRYRHEIVRDLQRREVRDIVDEFARRMRGVRSNLAQVAKLRYRRQQQRWFLDAVDDYCTALTALGDRLFRVDLASRGLNGFRDHVAAYSESSAFCELASATRGLREELAAVKYCVHVRMPRVIVRSAGGEADYGEEVEKAFARFQQGAVEDYRVTFPEYADMNHVEAQILDRVALLYPVAFRDLSEFFDQYQNFRDPITVRFDREIQFYLAYLGFVERLANTGLAFSLPEVTEQAGETLIDDGFDLALAAHLAQQETAVVGNSVHLAARERIVVVTGPNQGGKTTFARMFGQVHYLAKLGLPVPARRAVLILPDRVFSIFGREESLATLRGKLDDELVRIRDALAQATDRSVIVMNESFASSTLHDARFIGTEVIERIIELGSSAVYVTFVDDLSTLGDTVVSMVGGIDPGNPRRRTYQITRRPADGLAYAEAIATKYGLTYDALKGRIRP